jgi:hypothetical protein
VVINLVHLRCVVINLVHLRCVVINLVHLWIIMTGIILRSARQEQIVVLLLALKAKLVSLLMVQIVMPSPPRH